MISFSNDWTVFLTRPVSGAIMAMGLVALSYPLVSDWIMRLRKRRQSERTRAS